jgi:3-oxoacyl-[acyl-carrier-protein] synthase II
LVSPQGRRVVVTGMGAIAPNGPDTKKFWECTVQGVSGVRRIRSFDVSDYPCQIGGEAIEFHAEQFVDHRTLRRTGRAVHLGVGSVRMAIADSGLEEGKFSADDTAVIYGTGCPAIDVIARDVDSFTKCGLQGIDPYKLAAEDTNSVAAAIREEIGTSRLAIVISSGCTAGVNAIGLAADRIRTGQAKVVVSGSADAPLSPFSYAVFCASGIMTKRNSEPEKASRPFDLKRDGGALSEGAGTLILEPVESALRRRASIYGEILGFASVTQERRNHGKGSEEAARDAFVRAMVEALAEARISPADVDYISAHAPSDPQYDRIETEAIKLVFGEGSYRVPISSIKSCIGNPISAAGLLQTIAALLSIRDGVIPPTINYEYPDSACDLDCVPNKLRYNHVNVALINAHGLGGSYSSLVVGRFNGFASDEACDNRYRSSTGENGDFSRY